MAEDKTQIKKPNVEEQLKIENEQLRKAYTELFNKHNDLKQAIVSVIKISQ